MKKQYLYLMQRTGKKKAIVILVRPFRNARAIEQKLHKKFEGSRFKMSSRVSPWAWLQQHIKIGISTSPIRRLKEVNKDFSSGHTEWFSLNWLELLLLNLLIYWYATRHMFLVIALVIGFSLVAFLYTLR